MIRILTFFVLALACALGTLWLSDLPGDVSVNVSSYQIEAKLGVIITLIMMLVIISIFIWAWIRKIFQIPRITTQFLHKRKRDRGYSALSSGLISMGAGDEKLARKYGLTAERLLKKEPAVQLLLAQIAQMSGDKEEARNRFELMTQEKETRLLGLRGLYIEATRQNESDAAQYYAEEAASLSPSLPWAAKAVLNIQIASQNWQKALHSLERNYHLKLIPKHKYHRQKAVMMTALAMEMEQGDPEQARNLAMEAYGLDKSLISAAVLVGRLLTRRGDIRKATKILKNSWKISPHPEIAQAYAHVRPGDSVQDRWNRAKDLAKIHSSHPESVLMLAQVALEAQKFYEARTQLEKALKMNPTRRAYLLMAKLEEMENGDHELSRRWLSNAIDAPRDFAWIADGVEFENWSAVSPISKSLDAFRWEKPKHAIQSQIYEIGTSQDKFDDLQNNSIEMLSEDISQETSETTEATFADQTTTNQEGRQNSEELESSEADSTTKIKKSDSDKSTPEHQEVIDVKNKSETVPKWEAKADTSPELVQDKDKNEKANHEEKEGEFNSNSSSKKTEPKESIDPVGALRTVDFPLKHAPDDPGPSIDNDK